MVCALPPEIKRLSTAVAASGSAAGAFFADPEIRYTLTHPELYNNFKENVITDLGWANLQLAVTRPDDHADIRSYYIRPPYVSSWITESGAYVLLPNEEALQGLLPKRSRLRRRSWRSSPS